MDIYMEFKKRYIVIPLLTVALVSGWKISNYFFDAYTPEITISGINSQGTYAGDMQCAVASSKKGLLSVWLDGQPLINEFKISSNFVDHPFIIPTKTLTNAKHTLKVQVVDSTFNHNKKVIEREFYVDNVPLQVAFVRSEGDNKVFQGRTLHVQFQVNKDIEGAQVSALSQAFTCFPESKNSSVYECFIPVACEEAPGEFLFTVNVTDKVGNSVTMDNKFMVVAFPFKKQTLTVTAQKLQEEKEIGAPSKDELEKTIGLLSARSEKQKLWRGAFCTPIDVTRVSCDFGTIRTTQERGRYMHKALDLVNTPKSVVWASQDGIVVLKERYDTSGNTVIIDHGWGVLSMYYHLDQFADIKIGQKIAKGNPVGTLGKTGYASGYHLHWEMRINNVAVDPMQWTRPTF